MTPIMPVPTIRVFIDLRLQEILEFCIQTAPYQQRGTVYSPRTEQLPPKSIVHQEFASSLKLAVIACRPFASAVLNAPLLAGAVEICSL
jgi:hypothetical protein